MPRLEWAWKKMLSSAWPPRLALQLAYYLVRPRSSGALAGTKLKFNYGQGIQEPDIFSASNSLFALLSQLPDGPQLISQFHVGPIGAVRSRSFDAGIEQYFWSGRAKLGVTFFDNHFSDEIEFVSPGGLAQLGVPDPIVAATPFGASVNSLATRSLGAETELELSLGHGFTARTAYTYLDGVVRRSFSSDELFPSFNPLFPNYSDRGIFAAGGEPAFQSRSACRQCLSRICAAQAGARP